MRRGRSSSPWVDQIPEDRGVRFHADIAAELRKRPGMWREIGEYSYRGGAINSASVVRRGGSSAWRARPGGRYEAQGITTEGGRHVVFARWVLDGGLRG